MKTKIFAGNLRSNFRRKSNETEQKLRDKTFVRGDDNMETFDRFRLIMIIREISRPEKVSEGIWKFLAYFESMVGDSF